LKVPVILGFIAIEVNATDDRSGVNKVDFYVDGVLKETDTTAPYSWTWSERTPLKFKHTIKVIATDNTLKNTASAESVVWKFF
jgi:leucyl aminopeptidase